MALFDPPYLRANAEQPFTALISTADFFASPRGRAVLLRTTVPSPEASFAAQIAGNPDACRSDAIRAARP